MQDLNVRTYGIDNLSDHATEIATLSQPQTQYGNLSVALWQITTATQDLPVGAILLRESDAESRDYLLDATEAATTLANTDAFLRSCAREWAVNDDLPQLELYRWGLFAPADDAVDADYAEPVVIVSVGCYHGWTPIDYVKTHAGDTIEFNCAADAQAWIDEHNAGTYYLGHNEAGRPSYTIVKA